MSRQILLLRRRSDMSVSYSKWSRETDEIHPSSSLLLLVSEPIWAVREAGCTLDRSPAHNQTEPALKQKHSRRPEDTEHVTLISKMKWIISRGLWVFTLPQLFSCAHSAARSANKASPSSLLALRRPSSSVSLGSGASLF